MYTYDCYPVVSTSKSSSGSGRQRHFYDEVQLELLEAEFTRDPFPNREGRRHIAQLIGVSEKSIMWWFQNRRRRARQLGSSRAATSTRETNRQHRRSPPYVYRQRQQDTYDSTQVLPTPGFYSHPPVVPAPVEPINYSTSGSSSSSPLQSEWLPSSCPQDVVSPQSNYNNSDGTHQQPQQQDYSSYYWKNWEYSPPFYPTSLTNSTFYSNTVPDPFSSSYSYYSPETTNPYYYQSCM
ncbi:homeobox protein SEBOX-like [Daphnia pulicaria]|uniref:homeobox protein SEBOX-like n=1 Tax=Daphnia pulicaria TaxID=35523 RepID=UPI001EEB9FB6|nr:homeobox protein SEBOX-like [Daphnia pulicaria]